MKSRILMYVVSSVVLAALSFPVQLAAQARYQLIDMGTFGGPVSSSGQGLALSQHGLYARLMENLNALDSGVMSFAQRLAKSNPEATALIKRATWAGTDDWPALLEERAAMSGRLVLSEVTKQAIAAFSAR